ncbi:hypothetical protein LSH36_1381g00007 [Paralvinella palmiformis]|uniref:Uncharacterized protein n=1 Tax=Paralvinella palmiformis TaxID=53620 RepID=A0AAD9ITP8_9ANNE|nr:hypothetical protein LSH36_1381g00007 [Paralvinella palmiformis]
MAIQFLPAEYIPAQFEEMKAAGPPPTTNRLLAYYRAQWLENRVCPVAFWNAFNRTIRTNNDVEGWHHLFFNIVTNQSSLNMYKLIHLLHVEARNVNIQVSFLSNGALLRHHRKQIQKGLYIEGEPHNVIEGYLVLNTEEAYKDAQELLIERYGNSFIIGQSYQRKLDFLKSCRHNIPAKESQIPRPDTITKWTHLRKLAGRLSSYDDTLRMGLLIGINRVRANKPREVINGGVQ